MSDADRILTVREVAERLRCSTSTVKAHIARGKIAAINLGTATSKHYRVTERALAQFLDVQPEAAPTLPRIPDPGIVTHRYMKRLDSRTA